MIVGFYVPSVGPIRMHWMLSRHAASCHTNSWLQQLTQLIAFSLSFFWMFFCCRFLRTATLSVVNKQVQRGCCYTWLLTTGTYASPVDVNALCKVGNSSTIARHYLVLTVLIFLFQLFIQRFIKTKQNRIKNSERKPFCLLVGIKILEVEYHLLPVIGLTWSFPYLCKSIMR